MNLEVTIGNLTLANPIMVASGCFGYGEEYADLIDPASLERLSRKGFLFTRGPVTLLPGLLKRPPGCSMQSV